MEKDEVRREYRLTACDGEPNWSAVPAAAIDCYPWDTGGYRPTAWARLCRVGAETLRLRMGCVEKSPRAVWREPDSPVYQDSCLEFFVAPPAGDGYFNFEMNSLGMLLCEVGRAGDRVYLAKAGLTRPVCRPLDARERPRDGWGVELTLPLELFRAAFGPMSFHGGWLLGNFYKCGDHTAAPHYGCWSPVRFPTPNFHRPESFGRLILPD